MPARKKESPPKFTGDLNKRITQKSVFKRDKFPAWQTLGEQKQQEELYDQEIEKKLTLLFEHYNIFEGVQLDRWRELAIALAKDFVPGFQWNKKGAPRKWKEENLAFLVIDFEHIKTTKNLKSEVLIAKELAKREPWKTFIQQKEAPGISPNPSEVLRQLYIKNKDNTFVKHIREFYEHTVKTRGADSWDNYIYVRILKKYPHESPIK